MFKTVQLFRRGLPSAPDKNICNEVLLNNGINLKNLRFTGIEKKQKEWKLEEWHCLKIKNPLATKSMNCFTLIFGEACE